MKVGDKFMRIPDIKKGAKRDDPDQPIEREATIVYIHPRLRFIVVEYDVSVKGMFGVMLKRTYREAIHLNPTKPLAAQLMKKKGA